MTPLSRIEGPSVWRRADFSGLDSLLVELGRAELDAIDRAVAAISDDGIALEATERKHFSDPALEKLMSGVVAEVLHGRGLVVLGGLPCDKFDEATVAQVFWGLGRHFGTPVSQSVMGDRIGHVTDRSAEDPNARGYRHRYESSPHTDFQDVVGFFCLQPGAEGGMSWFASAHAIHNELLATRPDLLALLYRGFAMHRFGEEGPGEAPITEYRVPAFSEKQGLVSCRWVPRYVEMAANQGDGLGPQEREAFDAFNRLSMREDMGLGFTLERGQAVIMNNYTVLHGRSAFRDDGAERSKRHLVRLWFACDDKRPVVPEIALYASERAGQGVAPRAGQVPSHPDQVVRANELPGANL